MAGPMPGLLTLMEELYGRINKERLFGGGVRGAATRGLLGADAPPDATPAEMEAYRNFANASMALAAGPVAATRAIKGVKRSQMIQDALEGGDVIRGNQGSPFRRSVFHGSPFGPIEGVPRLFPHDENAIMSFSVSSSPEYAKAYAADYLGRHGGVPENPTVTQMELVGRVADYNKIRERLQKLNKGIPPTSEELIEYAKKKRIVGFDQMRNLGIDEIQVIDPSALRILGLLD